MEFNMEQKKSSPQVRVRVITLDKDAKKVQVAPVNAGQIKKTSSPVKAQGSISYWCC